MTSDLHIKLINAESRATKLIEKYGISAPEHIRLRDIAFDLGAEVVEGHLEKAAASLTRIGDCATIRVLTGDAPQRKRFSIVHELGHLVLNHTQSIRQLCSARDMERWYKPDLETEANFFASEMILPKSLVAKRCDVREVNFAPVLTIAKEFRASLTATAIKFVRLSPESCALVCSKEGKIAWTYRSRDWWPKLKIGTKLKSASVAYDFFQGKPLVEEPIEHEPEAWLDSPGGLEGLIEHSIASPNYGFVLSLLWIKQ